MVCAHLLLNTDSFIWLSVVTSCSVWGFPAGVMIRIDPSGGERRQSFGQGTERDSYQGYAITSGRFVTLDREDFAVSVPKRDEYFGRVSQRACCFMPQCLL